MSLPSYLPLVFPRQVEENGQEGPGGFYSSTEKPEPIEPGAVEPEGDGGVAALSEEQCIVDGGEKDHTSSPMVSGAFGESARDGVLSSETPDDETQLCQQEDVIAHGASHTGGFETTQEAGITNDGGAEGANCSDESGLVGVLCLETPDDETQHRQDVTANDPSHTGGLEAVQEAGISHSEADAEGAHCSTESRLVAGELSSETPDERIQHNQQGAIAHDVLCAGDLEAAQKAGISDKRVGSANGSATAQEAFISNSGGVEGANCSAERGLKVLNMAAKSCADPLPGEDGVRENAAEQRQLEESDELYDIDDLEMSSSDDT